MAVWRKNVPASGRAELEWVGVQGREEWEAHQRIEDPFMTFAFTEWTQCYWGNLAGVFQTSDLPSSLHSLHLPANSTTVMWARNPQHIFCKSISSPSNIQLIARACLFYLPVHPISNVCWAPLWARSRRTSWGFSRRWTSQTPAALSLAHTVLQWSLSHLDLLAQALKWPGQLFRNILIGFLSSTLWPSRTLLPKQRSQSGWPCSSHGVTSALCCSFGSHSV